MAKRILIIDDEEMITKSLQKLLNKKGYAATIVSGGREALNEIKTSEFDLVVLDIRMPQMDGIETIRSIREHLSFAGKKPIPEIVITGYADEDKYKNAVDLKVSAYIYKPFDTQEFLSIIERTLQQ